MVVEEDSDDGTLDPFIHDDDATQASANVTHDDDTSERECNDDELARPPPPPPLLRRGRMRLACGGLLAVALASLGVRLAKASASFPTGATMTIPTGDPEWSSSKPWVVVDRSHPLTKLYDARDAVWRAVPAAPPGLAASGARMRAAFSLGRLAMALNEAWSDIALYTERHRAPRPADRRLHGLAREPQGHGGLISVDGDDVEEPPRRLSSFALRRRPGQGRGATVGRQARAAAADEATRRW
jgi:hypothetical protein